MVFLIFFGGFFGNDKVLATYQTWCAIQYINITDSTLNSVAISLGDVSASADEICPSAATSLSIFSKTDNKFLSATGVSTSGDPIQYYITNTWSRSLTEEEKEEYWCFLNSADFGKFTGAADWLISFLPSSPESLRIPTQIQELFGQKSLAANLMIELYSAGWQFFVILALIKFYKLIPFKAT